MDKNASSYIELPAIIRSPKLSGGRIHKIYIDANKVNVGTWQGIYGNTVSKTLLSIPITQINSVKYGTSRMLSGQCVLTHLNEMGKQNTLNFTIVDGKAHSNQDYLTSLAAKTLDNLTNGQNSLPPSPFKIALNPPGLKYKFWIGFFLFVSYFLIGILTQDTTLLILFGAIVFFPSLVALIIDYMRNQTQWHPVIKLTVVVLAFCIMFILFVSTMAILDYYGII